MCIVPSKKKKTPMNGAISVGSKGKLNFYQPPLKCLEEKPKDCIALRAIGAENPNFPAPGKVLMVVGATGSGKSTFINALTNYIYGVDWNDDFRYKLVVDEGVPSQSNSQTSWITAYIFYKTNTYSNLPFTLTVIDTPGFGDTRGIQRDKQIAHQIKELFTNSDNHIVDQLHAIAFVAAASSVRLTPTQKYIFDATLSIFGKDIEKNIMLLATFADGQVPPVYEAARDAKVPFCEALKFNNSALYIEKRNDKNAAFDQMFWEMGNESLGSLFNSLVKMEPRSLYLTCEVLKEREHLEAVVAGIQAHMDEVLVKMENIKNERKILESHENDINNNKNFKYTVPEKIQILVPLGPGEIITTCTNCHITCHFPCSLALKEDKRKCAAMDETGHCKVCPGRCSWEKHENTPSRYDTKTVQVEKTYDTQKAIYDKAVDKKTAMQVIIEEKERELEELNKLVYDMMKETHATCETLKKIALKSNPLSEVEYIDLLIESEKSEKKEGYTDRISSLQDIRKKAILMQEVSTDTPTVQDKAAVCTSTDESSSKPGWRQKLCRLIGIKS